MYLHEDKNLFKNIIDQVSTETGRISAVIEKDYYVTMLLKLLALGLNNVVFKGGTSLSKGYKIIDRFSEDIDITFDEHLGEGRRKKLKNVILKGISEELEMPIINFSDTQSDRDYNAYLFKYDSVFAIEGDKMPSYIKLETALGSYSFPTQRIFVNNYIGEYLEKISEKKFEHLYGLNRFEMKLQAPERTYIDKIFALCDYYMQGKSKRYSRHLYDIYKLTQLINFDEDFNALFNEVREHRKTMKICPSAADGIDLAMLIRMWCKEDFYKEDYRAITSYFANDMVAYEDTIKQMMNLADMIEDMQRKLIQT